MNAMRGSAVSSLRLFPKVRKIPVNAPKSFILFPFELHEKMREPFEQKEDETLQLIINHLKIFKRPHVMTSHGNDSLVMCHLVIRACQILDIPLPAFWLNNTLNLYKEEKPFWDYINDFLGITDKFKIFMPPKDERGNHYTVWSIAEKVGHLPAFRRTARHKSLSYKHTNTPECCDILKKESIKQFLKKLKKEERYDLVFVGTRAQESQMRSLGVLQRCRSYLQKTRTPYPKQVVTPLSFWTDSDIMQYYATRMLPRNPTYEIHNLKRMGCASCPAYIGWEKDQASDPTGERFGMLKQNLKMMKKFIDKGTESPERLTKSIAELKKYLQSPESNKLPEKRKRALIKLIKQYDPSVRTLEDYTGEMVYLLD